MDWTAAIDIYCERTSAGFWAEPVNAWSNLAFPAAALWVAVAARRRGGATPAFWALAVLAALVGAGSFLFHTFGNVWSEYADTIPIWTFVAATLFVAATRVAGLRPHPAGAAGLVAAVVLIVTFLAATDPHPAVPPPPDPLNGSLQYAPALIALATVAAFAWSRRLPIASLLLAATLVFLAALVFRTIDMAVCATFPLGTHFLWHLLNGLTVGLILTAMLATDPGQCRVRS
ncbi:ceramidase domain-containing protein [Amaricoccus sp.]|uniref:ceramidase domain-containing protein n=1 Tax=Amaricoccus sp. TaxID=1872485 RepID=UPI002610FD46|nr:ceramidase domain-containing protein [Amaricoccus sp.]HRO12774.1 ceramidase domain-containing protein [Amaricoccus sp.]